MLAGDRMPSGRIIGARDTKPAHLVLQRSSLKSEALCGSPFAGYSSGRAFQSIEDCLPLCLLEGGRCRDNGAASGSVQLCSWHIQFVPLREYHAALNEVLQLADISWPIGIHQSLHRGSWDRPNALLHTPGEARHKKVDQEFNVFAPFAQRRDFNGKHPQPVEKVLAKLIIPNHAFQIAMRGRNQTNLNLDGLCTSEAFKLLFLQGTQEFRLQIHADVADLVKKKTAVIRQLKAASLLHEGTRESTLFVAEEFAFHQTRRNRRTVQTNKCALPPRAESMNCPGNQFLPGTGLTMKQYRGTCWRHDCDLVQHFPESRALADYVFEVVFRFDFRFEVKPLLFQIVARGAEPSIGQSILQYQRDLGADLRQQVAVRLVEPTSPATAHGQQAQGAVDTKQWHQDSRQERFRSGRFAEGRRYVCFER